jgi:transposase InsO family protein
MRAVVVGESGCGKTTLLLNLLLQDKWLDYDKLILCGKSLHQPEYELLTSALEKGYNKKDIRRLFEQGSGDVHNFITHLPRKRKPVIELDVYDCSLPVPDPRDLDRTKKNLCVFDDMVTESNQSLAESYYTRGRHNNVSCIYISQSYHMLPRQTIRSNTNCLILFRLPNKDLRHIHDDIVSGDMPYQEFNQFCQNVWQQDHGYIIINRTHSPLEGRYMANFEHVYLPENYVSGRGLVNTMLKKLPMSEMHLSLPSNVSSEQVSDGSFNTTGKYSFCGPFTKLDKRLVEGYEGVNSLDEACRRHDIAYTKYKKTKERNVADDVLAQEASAIALDESKPEYERRDARLVTGIMGTKSRFGLGVDSKLTKTYYNPRTGYVGVNDLVRKTGLPSSTVQKWLESQDTYTLHKPIKHRFPTRRVLVNGIDDQWQADLVDMQGYKDLGYRYILTVIDVFSKYAWAIPIKRKTGEEVSTAFRGLFKQRKPRKLHTDKGLEFINKPTKALLKEQEVHWFATENESKAQVVERFNRTLKNKMWRYFTQMHDTQWVKVLPDLMYNYNTSKHRSIGMTPQEASLEKNEAAVYKKLYPPEKVKVRKPKFQVGDHVRITVKRGDFRKGYRPNFTRELFIITEALDTKPFTYRIKDFEGEVIEGSFYEQEMVKVKR